MNVNGARIVPASCALFASVFSNLAALMPGTAWLQHWAACRRSPRQAGRVACCVRCWLVATPRGSYVAKQPACRATAATQERQPLARCRYQLGDAELECFDTPGHTRGHVTFHFPASKALFPGAPAQRSRTLPWAGRLSKCWAAGWLLTALPAHRAGTEKGRRSLRPGACHRHFPFSSFAPGSLDCVHHAHGKAQLNLGLS